MQKRNLVFLTMSTKSIVERGVYTDLLRKFRDEGYEVYMVSPKERRQGLPTTLDVKDGIHILGVKTLNLQKTNVVEKGIGQVLLESQYKHAIKKYFRDVKFDLILYSTPPISFSKVISFLKKNNPQAKTYLLLKDIFPQNSVDLGLLSKKGLKSIIYRYFRRKEKQLYSLSDYIGCMSPANVDFIIKHNPEICAGKVEVAPNSFELKDTQMDESLFITERSKIRKKYDLPIDKPIFIYGGNLGKPQGVDYLIKCMEAIKKRLDCQFLIIGTGTEYYKLEKWVKLNEDSCVKLMSKLPREDYDMLVGYCDVGLIFLDYRFTIPNYPSRLLSYLENKMPIICASDKSSDIGKIAEENGYGYWCESVNPEDFVTLVDKMMTSNRKAMGERGYQYMKEHYLTKHTYNAIMSHFK